MAQWVKDPLWSLRWLRWLLWHGFNPWPGNFHRLWAQPKKEKKRMHGGAATTLTQIKAAAATNWHLSSISARVKSELLQLLTFHTP